MFFLLFCDRFVIFFLRLVVALTQAMRVELGNVTASLEALRVTVDESERYG